MDVQCPVCKTEYEIEENKISEAGVVLKCSECSHTFRVKREVILKIVPMDATQGTSGFKIRTGEGKILDVHNFREVYDLILTHKLQATDEITRTGGTWRQLGGIVEFSPFFSQTQSNLIPSNGPAKSEVKAPYVPETALFDTSVKSMTEGAEGMGPTIQMEMEKIHDYVETAKATSHYNSAAKRNVLDDFSAISATQPVFEEELANNLRKKRKRQNVKVITSIVILLLLVGVGLYIYQFENALFKEGLSEVQSLFGSPVKKEKALDELRINIPLAFYQDTIPGYNATRLYLSQLPQKAKTGEQYFISQMKTLILWGEILKEGRSSLNGSAQNSQPTDFQAELAQVKAQGEKLNFNSAAWNSTLALYYWYISDNKKLAALLENRVDRFYRDDSLAFIEAWQMIEDQKGLAPALKILKQAVLTYPEDVWLKYYLAKVLDQNQAKAEAKAHLEAILEKVKPHRAAHLLKTLSGKIENLPKSGDKLGPEKTEKIAKKPKDKEKDKEKPKETALDGLDYQGNIQRGQALQLQGNSTMALTHFQKALQQQPNNPQPHSEIAWCYMDKGQYQTAITYFNRALNLNSTHGNALIGLAEVYKNLGQKPRAKQYYQQYLKLYPTGPSAYTAKKNIQEL